LEEPSLFNFRLLSSECGLEEEEDPGKDGKRK
jgi:hypothetical protein